MIKELELQIWDQVAGYAAYKDSRLVYFEYAKSFPLIYNLAPIMMPRSKHQARSFDLNETCFYGLPGLLADSLPDKYGNQMINAWFTSQGVDLANITALDRLCYLGTRAMGALEFYPSEGVGDIDSSVELPRLVDLSQQILQERLDFSARIDDLNSILQIGSSAGGARAKAIIALNSMTAEICSGQSHRDGFEQWIIKLDGVSNESLGDPLGYTNIEYAYYLMAVDCGIEMTESKLLKENGRSHFLTKRFDRTNTGEKLHMQTLCALAHLDYSQARVHSYEILFRVANLLRLSMHDKEQLFKRMVFNVVAKNHDDHTKNFSFLMNSDAQWSLAPAYDLTFAYNPKNHWLKEHNLLVNGKSTGICREDLLVYARAFHIAGAAIIINQVQEVVAGFASYAKKAGVAKDTMKYIRDLIYG